MDDVDQGGPLIELASFAMPNVSEIDLTPSIFLDNLEAEVMVKGWEAMRALMVAQWRLTDERLVAQYREQAPETTCDGHDALKVACRLGLVWLPRQECYDPGQQIHVIPGNEALPEHEGMVTTRGLQEWVCLLPQDVPFDTTQRLLGWMTHEPEVLSATQGRRLVRQHGQLIREAEQAEVEALLERGDLTDLKPNLTPSEAPRRRAAWPAELNAAVETALASADPQPPEGVSAADWERVLEARKAEQETSVSQLRKLGPEIQPDQIVVATDDVEVRRPERRKWWSLRTARIATQGGYRYLSGAGETVLQQLYLLILLCGGATALVTLLGDGASWIRTFFTERLAHLPLKELVLDWWHLRKKCYELTSMICRGRKAKAILLGRLLIRLWRGQVEAAIACLEAYRSEAKNAEKLDELIHYLSERRAYIPNYGDRRAHRQFIGSGHGEKANDLMVARRQKKKGMHWSWETSDALAALRTLLLNGGWDLYWQKHQVLPLAVPVSALT
jgi:hypothetical protein